MNPDSAWNMYVFRDGRRTAPGPTLARVLAEALRTLVPRRDAGVLDALLLAGEFECGLTDAASPHAPIVAQITDALAAAAVHPDLGPFDASALAARIPEHVPERLNVSPPEGFAYYALHPLDFADLAAQIPLSSGTVGIIGIRSIGATLSALVLAAIRKRGLRAERLTVRPTGHPYDRKTHFSDAQQQHIDRLLAADSEFLVVDEGPGMSGSSFLSVGDALVERGVPASRITFLGSRVPDPDALRATNGGPRWRSYRSFFAQKNSRLPLDAKIYVGAGDWRRFLYSDPQQWPASWTQMERLKFLSPDHRLLFKFEGFGHFGRAVYDRSQQIAQAGFGPRPLDLTQGFVVYPFLTGATAGSRQLTTEVLDRLAAYCAFRAAEFPSGAAPTSTEIETMVRFNVSEEFGIELRLEQGSLHTEHPVLADGRMLPHEWIVTTSGELMKVDAASHCDDHFFPGPSSDIAWDLAGAIIEWGMPHDAASYLLTRYRQLTDDNPVPRITPFLIAYSVFRLGYCKMAAGALRGSGEEHRLLAAHNQYRSIAEALLTGATRSAQTETPRNAISHTGKTNAKSSATPEQPLAA